MGPNIILRDYSNYKPFISRPLSDLILYNDSEAASQKKQDQEPYTSDSPRKDAREDTIISGKYMYQPMTPVEQLPSTEIPARPREPTNTIQISVSLTEHFLKFASVFQPPLPPDSPRYCMISDLFIDNYQVKCINGKMCYVQKQPALHSHKMSPEEVSAHDALISKESNTPKIDHCSSPSSSEDSGINAIGAHYVESCDEDTEEGAELSSEEDYSPESSWEPDECTLLSPSQSDLEVIETIETTV
ncbi:hypothetical protein P7K49_030114 [Saguinus oedipus]|uniref:Uncharacterized protein n=1 Tax=Saguinus oedipus TaxID=9490 RepID=A0ABQ9U177_SAGOE|nr:hypothetical protein P7K49_030114 [Saguinus oedipus]